MQQRFDITPSTLPRTDLLQWINTSLPCTSPNKGSVAPVKKVEQCGSGVPYVLLLPTMLPIPYPPLITKAKIPAHHEFEAVVNLKLMQEALQRNGIPKPDVLTDDFVKIINGNFQANLHLLQWFHGLYTTLKENGIEACQYRTPPSEARLTDTLGRVRPVASIVENSRHSQWGRKDDDGEQRLTQRSLPLLPSDSREPPDGEGLNHSRESSPAGVSQEGTTSPSARPKMKPRKTSRQEPRAASNDKQRIRPRSAPSTHPKQSITPSKATFALSRVRQQPTTPKLAPSYLAAGHRTHTPTSGSRSQSAGTTARKLTSGAQSPGISSTQPASAGMASRQAPAIHFITGADSNINLLTSGEEVARGETTRVAWSGKLGISHVAPNNGPSSQARTRRAPKLSLTKVEAFVDAPQETLPEEEEPQPTASRLSKGVVVAPKKDSDTNNGVRKPSEPVPPTDNSEVSYHSNSQVTSEALNHQLQEVTKERHFYYDKLRMIESLVLRELNSKAGGSVTLANSIKDILYSKK